jgi:methylenetetrahydrofolate dehydrogenase (NADP+)/methenyltetrahydrofolate cyclohydrolase
MLLNRDSTVSILHSRTKDVETYTKMADVVFLSAGLGEYFGREYFSPESIVVDISTVYKDGRWVGDARFEEIKDYVKAITPVPGGVGKITPLVLFDNLFRAVELKYGLSGESKAYTA